MSFTNEQLIGIGVVAVLGLWYLKNQTVEAAKEVGEAVNPINRDNIFNRAFNATYTAITGSEDSLGADIADWLHGIDG
mgnify:CR=1 FL=1